MLDSLHQSLNLMHQSNFVCVQLLYFFVIVSHLYRNKNFTAFIWKNPPNSKKTTQLEETWVLNGCRSDGVFWDRGGVKEGAAEFHSDHDWAWDSLVGDVLL